MEGAGNDIRTTRTRSAGGATKSRRANVDNGSTTSSAWRTTTESGTGRIR